MKIRNLFYGHDVVLYFVSSYAAPRFILWAALMCVDVGIPMTNPTRYLYDKILSKLKLYFIFFECFLIDEWLFP